MKDHELLFNLENFQKRLDLLSCNMLSQETKAKYYESYRKFLEAEKRLAMETPDFCIELSALFLKTTA